MNKKELISFEKEIVELFNDGKLKSPVHLSGGNEDEVIEIFKGIKKEDWVFTTYRSHYHTLLKGVNKDWLKEWILDNKSIHVMNKEYKIFTSAIVGGCLSIALGVALSIKINSQRKKDKNEAQDVAYLEPRSKLDEDNKNFGCKSEDVDNPADDYVYCFIGDMTSTIGAFHEVFKYAVNFKLPIKFIIENNFLSTDTDTGYSWGVSRIELLEHFNRFKSNYPKHFDYYTYKRTYPHYGTGKFVSKLWEEEDVKAKGF